MHLNKRWCAAASTCIIVLTKSTPSLLLWAVFLQVYRGSLCLAVYLHVCVCVCMAACARWDVLITIIKTHKLAMVSGLAILSRTSHKQMEWLSGKPRAPWHDRSFLSGSLYWLPCLLINVLPLRCARQGKRICHVKGDGGRQVYLVMPPSLMPTISSLRLFVLQCPILWPNGEWSVHYHLCNGGRLELIVPHKGSKSHHA